MFLVVDFVHGLLSLRCVIYFIGSVTSVTFPVCCITICLSYFTKKIFAALLITKLAAELALLIVSLSTLLDNPFSAGIDFRRQNLTSKIDPRAERVTYYNDREPIT